MLTEQVVPLHSCLERDFYISIIMPAYNAGSYIQTAINSVLAQTYPHWELIVVNDQSSDNTEHIIQTFNDPRICCYTTPYRFGKPSIARNYGVQHAGSQFVFFWMRMTSCWLAL